MPQSSGHPDMEAVFLSFRSQTHSYQAFVWVEGLLTAGEAEICTAIIGASLESFSLDPSLCRLCPGLPPFSFHPLPLKSCLLSKQNRPAAPVVPSPPLERLIDFPKQGGFASKGNLVPVLNTMNFQTFGQTCPHTQPSFWHHLPSRDPELNGAQNQTSRSPGSGGKP